MGLRVNGSELPWAVFTSMILGVLWLGGLSVSVADNTKRVESIATNTEKLARIEEQSKALRNDVDEIRQEQERQSGEQKEQTRLLEEIRRSIVAIESRR